MINYAIDAAKASVLDDIFVNSDEVIFDEIAKNNVKFYLRPKNLGVQALNQMRLYLIF